MNVRHKAIRSCALIGRTQTHIAGRSDPFAELVRQVAGDPDNAYNLDPYLSVLEDAPRPCAVCGSLFNAGRDYYGGPAVGWPRRYCSPRCAERAAYRRRRELLASRVGQRWGSAA